MDPLGAAPAGVAEAGVDGRPVNLCGAGCGRRPGPTGTRWADLYFQGGLRDDAGMETAMTRIAEESAQVSPLVEELLCWPGWTSSGRWRPSMSTWPGSPVR